MIRVNRIAVWRVGAAWILVRLLGELGVGLGVPSRPSSVIVIGPFRAACGELLVA